MPRVTEQYRRARRDEIARAALRCLERKGVHDTSIADIVEESGLSTGAIYSHFTSKAELARYIVAEFLVVRTDSLADGAREGKVHSPREILTQLLHTIGDDGLPPAVVLQFWAESTVDAELNREMRHTAAELLAALTSAVHPWALGRDRAGADELAARTARSMMTLAQGFIANSALLGIRSGEDYVREVAVMLAE